MSGYVLHIYSKHILIFVLLLFCSTVTDDATNQEQHEKKELAKRVLRRT